MITEIEKKLIELENEFGITRPNFPFNEDGTYKRNIYYQTKTMFYNKKRGWHHLFVISSNILNSFVK